jgi:hypothetical protein
MISSLEDFRLLLKKWQSESTAVSVMSVARTSDEVLAVVSVQGLITRLYETQFVVADKNRDSIATVNFKNCTFSYGRTEDMFGPEGAKFNEDCLIVALDSAREHVFVAVLSEKQK